MIIRNRSAWPILFLLEVSLLKKELIFIHVSLFVITLAGVVLCGGGRKIMHTYACQHCLTTGVRNSRF